jgi:hypothetical protein
VSENVVPTGVLAREISGRALPSRQARADSLALVILGSDPPAPPPSEPDPEPSPPGPLPPGATVNARLAGAPVWPAMSVARTENVCGPSESGPEVKGELQGENPPLSSWHSKLAGSSAVKVKRTGLFVVVPLGPEVIVVVGAVVSSS